MPVQNSTVLDPGETTNQTAQALADGKAVGWFQLCRMEFGPRALGGEVNSRRPQVAVNAEDAEPAGEVPRIISSICAVDPAGRILRTGSI